MKERRYGPARGFWWFRLVADGPLLWLLLCLYFWREGNGGMKAAATNGALLVAFAALHSGLARRGPKAVIARSLGAHLVRPAFVLVSGVSLGAVLALWRPLAGELWHAGGVAAWLLSALFAACVAGMVWSAAHVDYLRFLGVRDLSPAALGRPPRAAAFSLRGPYAHCRHPMYGFLFLALWIGPVMPLGRLEFALLGSLYLLAGTVLEERNLRQELGEVYDVYRANVPMWIPRLSPWRPAPSPSVGELS